VLLKSSRVRPWSLQTKHSMSDLINGKRLCSTRDIHMDITQEHENLYYAHGVGNFDQCKLTLCWPPLHPRRVLPLVDSGLFNLPPSLKRPKTAPLFIDKLTCPLQRRCMHPSAYWFLLTILNTFRPIPRPSILISRDTRQYSPVVCRLAVSLQMYTRAPHSASSTRPWTRF
jgi:hypothetical protein